MKRRKDKRTIGTRSLHRTRHRRDFVLPGPNRTSIATLESRPYPHHSISSPLRSQSLGTQSDPDDDGSDAHLVPDQPDHGDGVPAPLHGRDGGVEDEAGAEDEDEVLYDLGQGEDERGELDEVDG